MNNLTMLAIKWRAVKDIERRATEDRRALEDEIYSLIGISSNFEGVEIINPDGCSIKITGRLERKVDAEKAQEIARESGLEMYLTSLFRWKPELNITEWRKANERITKCFSPAVTVTPGRPSFSITIKE